MAVEQSPAASDPQAAQDALAATGSDAPAPPAADTEPPLDLEALKGTLRRVSVEDYERLAGEIEPLKQTFDRYTQRHQAKSTRTAQQERDEIRRELEAEIEAKRQHEAELADFRAKRQRQLDLADKAEQGDYDAERELLQDILPLFKRERLKEDPELRAHFMEAAKADPDVAAYFRAQIEQAVSSDIVNSVAAHPALAALSPEERWKVLNQPNGPALVDALKGLFTDGLISKKDAESMAAAAKQATLDAVRGGSRQPDTGPNAVTPLGSGLTRAAIRGMSQSEKIARAAEIAAAWEGGGLRA